MAESQVIELLKYMNYSTSFYDIRKQEKVTKENRKAYTSLMVEDQKSQLDTLRDLKYKMEKEDRELERLKTQMVRGKRRRWDPAN